MINLRSDIRDLDNPYADCFIINAEQFKVLCMDKTGTYIPNNILIQKGFDCVLFDEATKLRTHNSKIHDCFQELSKSIPYIFLMSGLPAPNSVFQLWGLMSCIGNWLGDSYAAFEERYGKQVEIRPHVMGFVPRRSSENEIKARIAPVSIYMTSEQYIVLPEYRMGDEYNIQVTMPEGFKTIYKELEKEYVCTINDRGIQKDIYANNEAALRSKLLQIMAGFIYEVDAFKNKTAIPLEWQPKLDALTKQVHIDLADPTNNVIIWTRFREELQMIYTHLSKYYLCAYGEGQMSDAEQKRQLDLWLENPDCRIMVCNPGSLKYGHTWNKANFTYYPSPLDDNDQYSQSRKRNYRRGQTRPVTERKFILKDTLELKIWTSIRRKIRLDKFLKDVLQVQI